MERFAKGVGEVFLTVTAALLGALAVFSLGAILLKLVIADSFFVLIWIALIALPALVGGGVLGLKTYSYLAEFVDKDSKRFRTESARWTVVLSVICVPIVLAAVGYFLMDYRSGPPGDDQLLADFKYREVDLNRLVAMTSKDKNLVHMSSDPRPESLSAQGIDEARWLEYEKLSGQTGVSISIFGEGSAREIEFEVWGVGAVFADDEMVGYAYLPKPPNSTVPNIEEARERSGGQLRELTLYRPIHGHWYLYYKYIPD